MVRILTVTNRYRPHSWGGYELICRQVVDRWKAAGHTVEVLTSDLRRDRPLQPDATSIGLPAYARRAGFPVVPPDLVAAEPAPASDGGTT